MNLPHNYDILIVGQGLAGSLLAWVLLQYGYKVCVVSDGVKSASHIAAGMINPVTGQRFVLAEHTPQHLKTAEEMYQQLGRRLHQQFYFPKTMLRIFNNEKERLHCQKRLNNEHYTPYFKHAAMPAYIHAPFSGIQQTHTAYIDTANLLKHLATHLAQHHAIRHQHFSAKDVQIQEKGILWQGIFAQKIIFCEGYRMQHNPFFSWLPLQAAHGEIITCHSEKELPPHIINQQQWLLPTDTHTCRIGATYEPQLQVPTIQTSSKAKLLHFAHQLFNQQPHFEVTQHQAGIRPNTLDKQPFIGFHPKHPQLGIFNGFGSRGCLLIPHYAQVLVQYMQQQQPLPKEVDIQRYKQVCV
ncbi:MAG: FAD-dependent oxidoreductase [Mariprofundaceae bacterium]|nr:FAD-dependent oxidoreductase [Mariprofundaceae bacterium]